MIKRQIFIGLFVVTICFCGCQISKKDYNNLLEQYNDIQAEQSAISQEYESLQSQIDNKVTALESELTATREAYQEQKSLNKQLKDENANLKEELLAIGSLRSGFLTLDDLISWIKQNKVNESKYSETYNCENFARDLALDAANDGYFLGLLDVDMPDVLESQYGIKIQLPYDLRHAQNYAVIDINGAIIIYIIEPQTDKITTSGGAVVYEGS